MQGVIEVHNGSIVVRSRPLRLFDEARPLDFDDEYEAPMMNADIRNTKDVDDVFLLVDVGALLVQFLHTPRALV
jgi:hypothetical protein